MTDNRALLAETIRIYRRSWKELALTDIAYKIIAFMVLTPLIGIPFRIILSLSGRSILADEDILFFVIGPWGWLCLIVVGGSWLGILALEQSALMHILCVKEAGQRFELVGSYGCPADVGRVANNKKGLQLPGCRPFFICNSPAYAFPRRLLRNSRTPHQNPIPYPNC